MTALGRISLILSNLVSLIRLPLNCVDASLPENRRVSHLEKPTDPRFLLFTELRAHWLIFAINPSDWWIIIILNRACSPLLLFRFKFERTWKSTQCTIMNLSTLIWAHRCVILRLFCVFGWKLQKLMNCSLWIETIATLTAKSHSCLMLPLNQ